MEKKFLKYIKDPQTSVELKLFVFKEEKDNLISGVLVNPEGQIAFPILHGVPVLLPFSFPQDFVTQYKKELQNINEQFNNKLSFECFEDKYSFSAEWEFHFNNSLIKTWGWNVEDRFEQFLLETQSSKKELNDKLILDAGCGNGILTEYISSYSGLTIGIDLSDSVFFAEKNRISKNVCFIKGNLQSLPFADGIFDIIVSNGVIHHTQNTESSFYCLSSAVKQGGKLYVWLYSDKGNFKWRIKRKFFDFARVIISRLNKKTQFIIVSIFATILNILHKNRDKNELRINMYDSLTPRWRHYHTPEEIAHWYYKSGFGPICLTHFDNKYGFGAYALKTMTDKTPGDNYDNSLIQP